MSSRVKLLRLLHRTGSLHRFMRVPEFRRLVGAAAATEGWRLLGATIADTALVGTHVSMLFPSNVSIGPGSVLGGEIHLASWAQIVIGANVAMNHNVTLFAAEHDVNSPTFERTYGAITVGDYVWLPHNIQVLPGVTIGRCAVVGTGSVVTKDVAESTVVAGNPARVIHHREDVDFTYVPFLLRGGE